MSAHAFLSPAAKNSLPGVCWQRWACGALLLACLALLPAAAQAQSFAKVIAAHQPKLVKIYGAGGFQRLEAYQSGFLVAAEGYVLTVWSYVLDTDYITVTLNDGRKFQAQLVGADPRLEIALLKIDATDLPFFDLQQAVTAEAGVRVLAFSNLYGVAAGNEPASVQHGVVAYKTPLAARKGTYETPYKGEVYVLDAMTNNPGAAGGALTDARGRFLGMLGKELRNNLNNTWLNYAIPAGEMSQSVADIRAGKLLPRATEDVKRPQRPVTLANLGLVLVPDVLAKTPPFVDRVLPGSPAALAGIRPDDLVLFVDQRVAPSCKALAEELGLIEAGDELRLTLQRGQELLEFTLRTPD